jgi:CRISPR system Cascade subunit CasB
MIAPPEKSERSLSDDLGSLCGFLGHPQFPTGELASLRRMTPDMPPGFSFHKLLLRTGIDVRGDDAERRWTIVVAMLASLAGMYAPDLPLGTALAKAGLSELRFVRLLRADDTLAAEVRSVSHILSSKAIAFDHRQLARLVLIQQAGPSEQLRRQIARDYYKALSTNE